MECKFCLCEIKKPCFDLGNTAISNDLLTNKTLHLMEKTYPLILYICPKCFLAQTEQFQKGFEIFDEDYVYFSSCSQEWLKHASKYVDIIINRLALTKKSFVIEVASNDGYLLQNFVKQDIKCLGIEPTKSTALVAMRKGIPTLVEFFDLDLAERLVSEESKADLIIANNVLAHVPEINNFIASFKKVLNSEGTITIEFPHLLNLVEKNEFDTIYHEHFFYFSILSFKKIFNKHALSIYDVDELDTHGGSLRIYVTHKDNDLDRSGNKKNVNKILQKELDYGMDSVECYSKIQDKAFNIKLNSLQYLTKNKLKHKKIAAFGAAAKGNTFLNYCGIGKDVIDFVVDETPYKIGKYMPQSKIPILGFDAIDRERPDIIIILPWNHKDEIIKKLSFTKAWGCEVVIFIPDFKILS